MPGREVCAKVCRVDVELIFISSWLEDNGEVNRSVIQSLESVSSQSLTAQWQYGDAWPISVEESDRQVNLRWSDPVPST